MHSTDDVIVLCGGAGLRLRGVTGNGPKAMASIGGRPFLELLLRQIARHGFQRAILAVGYREDAIRTYFNDRAFGLRLAYSSEVSPLGTGGALRKAVDLVESDTVLVMNGDSYTEVNLCEIVQDYRLSGAEASVLVVPADGRSDCGRVSVNANGKLTRFGEKRGTFHAPYVNAGIYGLSRAIASDIQPGLCVSLEEAVIPRWLAEGHYIRVFVGTGRCIDIGTPERYREALSTLATVEMKVASDQHSGRQM